MSPATARRPVQRPEQAIQRQCALILQRFVPPPPEGPCWSAINPIPAKSAAVAGISKAMGMRAGVPDLLMIQQGRALFVEFKNRKGSLSAVQTAMRDEIEAAGGRFMVARDVEEFLSILRDAGIPCAART